MMQAWPKPKHLGPEYGAQFSDPSVASAYRFRPPYPGEGYTILHVATRLPRADATKQQRPWRKQGALLLLQRRVKTLHQEHGAVCQRGYPDGQLEAEPLAACPLAF